MSKFNNTNSILDGGWHSDAETWEQVGVLAAVATGREVRRVRFVLESILAAINSLGSDGLHEVIRAEAKRVRRIAKLAAAKSRKRREAKKLEQRK